jgi:hypothetical protein
MVDCFVSYTYMTFFWLNLICFKSVDWMKNETWNNERTCIKMFAIMKIWRFTLQFNTFWRGFLFPCMCEGIEDTQTLITNKCTKRVLSSIVTHSYMFRPCWVIFRENVLVIATLRLHFIVEWECAVDCVLRCFRRQESQSTAHSHSTIKCNLSVVITRTFSLKMTQQGRNM